jgi:hypothetical protein
MEIKFRVLIIAGSLALLFLGTSEPALACPSPLYCSNFTDYDKKQDCQYVNSQSLNYSQKQELLCILWDQTYGYDVYQSSFGNVEVDLILEAEEIDNSSFILAWKIFVFGLMNYIVFSFGKSSIILRWLGI